MASKGLQGKGAGTPSRDAFPIAFPFQTVTGLGWGEIDGGDELLKKQEEKNDNPRKLEQD